MNLQKANIVVLFDSDWNPQARLRSSLLLMVLFEAAIIYRG